jgi:tetratricopeptide (TPR) repeat protein
MELVPGLPVDAMIRATVLPRHPMMALHAATLTSGLEAYYRIRGDVERVRAIRRLRQRDVASDITTPPTRDRYRELVATSRQALTRGDSAAALEALAWIIQYPNQPYYYEGGLKLAETLAGEGRHEKALETARMLELQFPAYPMAFTQEIRLLRQLGRDEQARAVLERGLFYNPAAPSLLKLRSG